MQTVDRLRPSAPFQGCFQTGGDCPNFAQSAEQNGTVHFSEPVVNHPFRNVGRRELWSIAATIALVTLLGCDAGGQGKTTAHLQGKITIDGSPLPANAAASIVFKPTTPGQAKSTGVQILNSQYDCANVPLGNVKVYFDIQQPTGKTINEGGRPLSEMNVLIAPESAVGIELEVTEDDYSQDFDLDSA